jgi:hypothetical protein
VIWVDQYVTILPRAEVQNHANITAMRNLEDSIKSVPGHAEMRIRIQEEQGIYGFNWLGKWIRVGFPYPDKLQEWTEIWQKMQAQF